MMGIGSFTPRDAVIQPQSSVTQTSQVIPSEGANRAFSAYDHTLRGLDHAEEYLFHQAAAAGNCDEMQKRFDAASDFYQKRIPQSQDEHELTALHKLAKSQRCRKATLYDKLAETVQLLLAHGANIDAQDAHGRTPLMLAAMEGDVDMLHILLDRRANMRLKDSEGCTAEILGEVSVEEGSNRVRECFIEHKQKRSIQAILARPERQRPDTIINLLKRKCAAMFRLSKKES